MPSSSGTVSETRIQRAIVNALPADIALLDVDGVITSVNEAWCQFGHANGLHSPGHAVGANYLSVCDRALGDDAPIAHQAAAGIRSVLDGAAASFALEYPCHAPTVRRWFKLTATPIASGHLMGAVVMHVDITERVRIAEQLHLERAELRVLFDLMPAMIWFKDAHNRILKINQSAADAAGRPIAQIEGRPSAEIYPDDATRFYEDDLEVIRSKAPKLGIVETLPGPDGANRWVQTDKVPFFDKDGQVAGVVVMAQDITARRQVECDLRDSELRFRQMAENINDVFFLVDAVDNRMLYVSPAYERLTQRSRLSLQEHPESWIEVIHPDDRQVAFETFRAGVAAGKFEHECRVQHPDGSTGWIRAKGFPVRDEAGRIVRIAGVATNVTESKLAENRLRESEARFRQMAENINDVFFLQDARTCQMLYVSPAYAGIWGRTCESLYANPQDWIESIHSDDRVRIQSEYEQGLLDGKLEFDYRIVRPDGSVRWVETRGFPIRDESGAITRITGVAKDVTTRRQAAQDLIASERRFSDMLGNVQLATVMLDRDARITYCNGYLLTLTGWKLEEVIGRDWFETFMPAELGDRRPDFESLLAELPDAWHVENELFTRTRERRLVRWNNSVLRSTAGDVIGVASIGEDITERRRDEIRIKYLNRVHAVLSGINTLIVRVRDREELFREACRIAVEAGGFRLAMIGILDPATDRIVPRATAGEDQELLDAIGRLLASPEGAEGTVMSLAVRTRAPIVANDSRDDPRIFLRERLAEAGIRSIASIPLLISGEAIGALALFAGESEFFHAEEMVLLTELTRDIAFAIDHIVKGERLDYVSDYDPLTGLANRSLFLQRVTQYMRNANSAGYKLAVGLIDLERFKNINDSLGQLAGDALLEQVAEWLSRTVGNDGLVARVEADHFAIVLPEIRKDGDVSRLLDKMIAAFLAHPFRLNDAVFRIGAKGGVALFPDDGDSADVLFKYAEAALKQAKAHGDRYLFYTQAMTDRAAGKPTLENQLRQAIDNEEFVLHYQPKVNLISGLLVGAEALIRWNDPRTGLVPPFKFIPILEETGLIHEVGRWAMRKAIEDYLRWRSAGLPAVRIAVNVSALQLRSRGFIAEVKQAVAVDERAAAGLELEITESMIMEDIKQSVASLQAIRALGVGIAMDDFGTGFSSLGYLSKLPIDTLKIDRSFVIEMTVSPQGLSLVSTIINLAHSLQLKVVGEGVETEEQSRLLRLLGCDEMQGYLFSKPVPGEIFEAKFLALPTAAA